MIYYRVTFAVDGNGWISTGTFPADGDQDALRSFAWIFPNAGPIHLIRNDRSTGNHYIIHGGEIFTLEGWAAKFTKGRDDG